MKKNLIVKLSDLKKLSNAEKHTPQGGGGGGIVTPCWPRMNNA